jgi:5-methylcytosine-specific restriction endonuclease McrA
MPRRETRNTTGIRGTGAVDANAVWRVFECFSPGCDQLMKISEDLIAEQRVNGVLVAVECPKCGFQNAENVIERAARWKYCRVCEWLQPLDNFHKHKPRGRAFRSGHQLECRICKNTRINLDLNPKRTSDQHREASQRRRLYSLISAEAGKIDSHAVFERFGGCCFNCNKPLTYKVRDVKDYDLDHTLPAKHLWPLSTGNATLLCSECNNAKHDKWPSEFYTPAQLKALARLTSIEYECLSGPPRLNPKAVEAILANVDRFIEQWIAYPDDLKKVRQLIQDMNGIDIFASASTVPDFLQG